jgi:C4-dicarboxylate-specific signal transduction histidine kinase
VADDDYKMLGFANALSQVLLNILNNAKDILIDNQIKEKKIWINLFKRDEFIVIEIEDNAGGIPENIIDKIFDPYFSTKLEKNGTGLGLYMSRMIVQEQMKSTLKVKNTDRGAKFEIALNPNGVE